MVLSLSVKPESFGRTVLEALSLGVPVVGYDHGGVGEVLESLFPQGRVSVCDQGKMLETVISVLSNKPVVQPQSQYLLGDMLNETISMYESLAKV